MGERERLGRTEVMDAEAASSEGQPPDPVSCGALQTY